MSAVAPRISVVICAYTLVRWPDLVDAIASVKDQRVPAHEILLVVDGNDELLERAIATFTGVRIVVNRHAPGISGGRNTGTELAGGEVIAFLDDDAIAEPQWLEKLAGAYRDDDVLGAGGEVVPRWRDGAPAWFPAEFNWVVGCTHTGMPHGEAEIRNPIGANFSVRRDVVAQAGGFDATLGRVDVPGRGLVAGTAEETEFCLRSLRARPAGRWMYVPEARVHHAVPAARGSWAYFSERCRLEGAAKASLTRMQGSRRGLSSERTYVRSVLPRAVVGNLVAWARGERRGAHRAGAIVAGLALTTGAYAGGLARSAARS